MSEVEAQRRNRYRLLRNGAEICVGSGVRHPTHGAYPVDRLAIRGAGLDHWLGGMTPAQPCDTDFRDRLARGGRNIDVQEHGSLQGIARLLFYDLARELGGRI